MGTVTALRSPEKLALITIQNSLRKIDARGVDGLWLRKQLLDLCYGRVIPDADRFTLRAYNLLEEDGTPKTAVRTIIFAGAF